MNYGQGILLEEGTAAYIVGNHIARNIKANIALGGSDSENTKIMFNHIEKSKQEGIFVVEGGKQLMIDSNIIMENLDGIVLLHSDGQLTNNKIIDNQRCGISLVSESTGLLKNNVIENNYYGIEIKDPSLPEIIDNRVQSNQYQLSLDKNAKRNVEDLKKLNPDIIGNIDMPQGTCNIF